MAWSSEIGIYFYIIYRCINLNLIFQKLNTNIFIGVDYCESVGLTLTKNTKTVYDPSIMPQLAVEFPGGCFRVTHNTVPSIYL